MVHWFCCSCSFIPDFTIVVLLKIAVRFNNKYAPVYFEGFFKLNVKQNNPSYSFYLTSVYI